MIRLLQWFVPAVLGGLVLLGPLATAALAQQPVPPVQPVPVPVIPPVQGNIVGTNPFQGYGDLAGLYGGGSGYNPYASSYYGYDPFGGYLRGAADVYRGQSQFVQAREQAKLIREQARQERIKTRKALFDQWLYEEQMRPNPEQIRQKQLQQEITHSLNSPHMTEVASGAPMNYLLDPLADMLNRNPSAASQPVPLDRDQVRKLNVTRGNGSGSVGLLRNQGKLSVPVAIATLAPADDTKAALRDLETFTRVAYEQASAGPVDANVIRQLEELSKKLNERLTRNINDYDLPEYSEGKRFLRGLDDAIASLRQPDASSFISGQFAPQSGSVQELVKHMTSKGLRFAPANPGDEQAYSGVHSAMVGLFNSLKANTVAAGQPPAGPGGVSSDRPRP